MKSSKFSIAKTLLVSSFIFALALTVSACGGGSKDSGDASGSGAKTIEVSLIDDASGMSINPASVTVDSGTNVTLKATNDGTVVHNLTMDDGMATADIAQYAQASLEVGKVTETTVVYCSIAGHRDQGMEITIEVE